MGMKPATLDLAVLTACPMGLGDQQGIGSRLNRDIGSTDNTDSATAKRKQLHGSRIASMIKLKQPLLRIVHWPIGNGSAITTRARNTGKPVKRQ